MDDAIADWDNVGVLPDVLVWVQGEADSQTSEQFALDYFDKIFTLAAKFKTETGAGIGFVIVRVPVIDAGYPYADIVREMQENYCAQNFQGKFNKFLDPTEESWYDTDVILQADDIHLNGIGMYHFGKLIGQYLQSEGYG